eukprot:TRINITY_DN2060_c0_g1_i1.p3 TRINITY_DN2060_c0_g1~~TRINITY_DN2060_c0_g1_i1.p3  ORF type:complete len:132 (-),score=15.47 TRINITY_DN2060_c0_g1_i1:678-1073(-)
MYQSIAPMRKLATTADSQVIWHETASTVLSAMDAVRLVILPVTALALVAQEDQLCRISLILCAETANFQGTKARIVCRLSSVTTVGAGDTWLWSVPRILCFPGACVGDEAFSTLLMLWEKIASGLILELPA